MRATAAALTLGVAMAACSSVGGSSSSTSGGQSTSPSTVSGGTTTAAAGTPVNPAAIPLGDGHVSTSPRVGYVDTCRTSFNGGGAEHSGPWLDAAAGTWDSKTKISVEGSVSWPSAHYSVSTSGGSRIISTNDLPISHTTGTFPIAPSDPAFQYDHNPNMIEAQSINWTLPADPSATATPSCVALGPIGVLDDGVLLFNALDAAGRDAGAHEVLDACGEHPQMNGMLHHHDVPACIMDKATGASTLVGYAADGYGIYVERDANGDLLTNTGLDACHGRTSAVMWNGSQRDMYHYDATLEYPYTIGCYHGTPIQTH
jgi:hypothetical protein